MISIQDDDIRDQRRDLTPISSVTDDIEVTRSACKEEDKLEQAAIAEARSDRLRLENPEPSLGSRLGQIGLLGWMIIVPMLSLLWAGRWIDTYLGTHILFSSALMMSGAVIGLWLAWRWMQKQ